MVIDDTRIVSNLNTILPVYTEYVYNSSQSIPCITYVQSNMHYTTDAKTGADVKYADIGYDIKLWTKDKSTQATNSDLIDTKMRSLGYTLSGVTQTMFGNLYCLTMVYSGLALEY